MTGQIFISYRREDSAALAGRLFGRLSDDFPSKQIFMDVYSIDFGENFVETIKETVGSCDVLIAVIGKSWLTSRDQEGQRRLDNPDDFVRLEITTALQRRDIRVIPVLVDGALMPQSRDLPDDLKTLVELNALQLNHDRFGTDSERLASAVAAALEQAAVERHKTNETELYYLYNLARSFSRQLLDRELPKLDSALLERDDSEKQRIIGNISNDLRILSAEARGMKPTGSIKSFNSSSLRELLSLHAELLTHLKVGLPAAALISETLHKMKAPNQFFLEESIKELNEITRRDSSLGS
jgi:hypothetical protein